MNPDRYLTPDPALRAIARELYEAVAGTPIVAPHGHVDPRLFADPAATFGTPADLFIVPDHYVTRMLYSQGVPLEILLAGDPRRIWRIFCEWFHLFRGTPSGIWLTDELETVLGIAERPSAANADRLYDQLADRLASPTYTPRQLFERFNIEVLCTTDAATDTLEHHRILQEGGWAGRIRPTFRPDGVVNLDAPNWRANLDLLSEVSGIEVRDYSSLVGALEQRRGFFKELGATATDHAALTPATARLSPTEADRIVQRALKGGADPTDAHRFTAHMLLEMARMSVEDGLVMQLHPGSLRNHNADIFERFGLDKGADIPLQTEYTRNLLPLLNAYGNDPRFALVVFTLDETTYARELAPLAGHYPALKLGPPWWFHDSLNGITRFLDQVMETAGLYNTAGFNDDTRAFCSIPARHDVWRRAAANWLAGLVARHVVDMSDAHDMIQLLAVGLARRAYRLPGAAEDRAVRG